MAGKVAVVTGANKGLGFGIVKLLCQRGVEVVYLTSRDVERGLEAVQKLKNDGLNPQYHQLDTSDRDSVQKFADFMKKNHGGLDILINNAAIVGDYTQINYEGAKCVIDINYRAILIIQEFLFHLLRNNARVINITSDCGLLSNLKNVQWIKRLANQNVTLEDVNDFVEWFLGSVNNNTLDLDDFNANTVIPYRVSKIAVNALTRIQQREVGRGISVNSIHPGYIKTDMTNNEGVLTVEYASEAPVYLALDIDQSVKGRYFWFDKSEKDWSDLDNKMILSMEDYKKNLLDFLKSKKK